MAFRRRPVGSLALAPVAVARQTLATIAADAAARALPEVKSARL